MQKQKLLGEREAGICTFQLIVVVQKDLSVNICVELVEPVTLADIDEIFSKTHYHA